MGASGKSPTRPAVVAIGDLHGHYPALAALLDAIHARYRIFAEEPDRLAADVQLVLTGDYIDRGTSALAIIERLRRVRSASERGQVVTLLGNHELLALEAFDTARALAREKRADALVLYGRLTLHGHPQIGGQAFLREFGPTAEAALESYSSRMARGGDVGDWVRALGPLHEASVGRRKVLFMHADLAEPLRREAALGRFRQEVESALRPTSASLGGTASKYGHPRLTSSASFFWNRSFWRLEDASPAEAARICEAVGVDMIVTGHTARPPRITCYGGRIFDLDVGMSPWFWRSPDRPNPPWALLMWENGRVAGFSASGEEEEFVPARRRTSAAPAAAKRTRRR